MTWEASVSRSSHERCEAGDEKMGKSCSTIPSERERSKTSNIEEADQ